jgi:hypothetical protein
MSQFVVNMIAGVALLSSLAAHWRLWRHQRSLHAHINYHR